MKVELMQQALNSGW